MKRIFIAFSACALAGTLTGATLETNPPVLAIYHSYSRPHTNHLAVALWDDGRIVWSTASTNRGAPPYRVGRFDPAKLRTLLDRLEHDAVFANPTLARPRFGPDAAYTTILVNDGRRRLRLQSWHEVSEHNPNLVATASGLQTLAGRKREQVLQTQPAEYRRFRQTWAEIRHAVTALIPSSGEPFDEIIPLPETRKTTQP